MKFYLNLIIIYIMGCLIPQKSHCQETFSVSEFEIVSDDNFKSEIMIVRFDLKSIFEEAKKNDEVSIILKINDTLEWNIQLTENNIISPGYVSTVISEKGEIKKEGTTTKTFEGYLSDNPNSEVRLTLNDDFLYGFIFDGTNKYSFEPYRFYTKNKSADRNQLVVYTNENPTSTESGICGNNSLNEKKSFTSSSEQNSSEFQNSSVFTCKRLTLMIASDYSMYTEYGADLESRNFGVMNNVQSNYDDEFNSEISFVVMEQYISTCNSCDPWTTSENAEDLLTSFKNWGNNYCDFNHLGQLWTKRNIYGQNDDGSQNWGVAGLAYVAGICNSRKYHILEDYTSYSESLRVLTAHEIGHNLGAEHNYDFGDDCSSTYIMDPAVNTTNLWSNGTQNTCDENTIGTINSFLGGNCLQNCLDMNEIWVDFDFFGCFNLGTFDIPFSSLSKGVFNVNEGGVINIKSGQTSTGIRIDKACILKSWEGSTIIGN